jgi:signal transduction histidine kinase/DNA-binding response OmpR family regulator/HPt (histidine-containing phosphotransfer) domain-containing protein
MLGMPMQDLLGEALFELNRPHVEAALQGKPQHFQRAFRKHDGSIGHTLASYIPDIVDERVRGFNVVISDVTELKQAEFRLENLNEQLALRAQHADQANKAKSDFLANMSHEIRTPMNAIIGLAHLVRRDTQDPLQRARLGKINDASQHLLHVINDILDLSKIEAGKMTLDEADFVTDELLASAFGMVNAQARAKSLELVLDCGALPHRLRGDAVRLSQCLINLLGNAVKFTDAGWICLRAEVHAVEAQRVCIRFEVQDTGPGIALDRQPALFSAFEQADNSATRRHGGTGLGLALTRHFARMMGGDAGVASEPGVGSSFWFTAWLGVVAEAGDASPDTPLRGLRALLVDDLPQSLQAVKRSLEALGLEVDAQAAGAQGTRWLDDLMTEGRACDFVLIDGPLWLAANLETWRQWRASPGSGHPACLLMTTFGDPELEIQASQGGFDALLVKPITSTALQDALVRALRSDMITPVTSIGPAGETELQLRRDHAGQWVLLVEDNPINQEVAAELLAIVGLQVETANDGTQAVERTRWREFDLVLMDVQMPLMDGLSATREIRRRGGPRTPILAMTANAFGDDRLACLAAGMDDHVAKPVDARLLYASLLRWLPPRHASAAAVESTADAAPTTGPDSPALLDRLQTVEGFDVRAGLRAVGGKPATLERVLGRFVSKYAAGEAVLASGEPMPPVEALGASSHSLRGACGSIGAIALQQDLERFEGELRALPDAARHGVRCRSIHDRLLRLVQQLKRALGD